IRMIYAAGAISRSSITSSSAPSAVISTHIISAGTLFRTMSSRSFTEAHWIIFHFSSVKRPAISLEYRTIYRRSRSAPYEITITIMLSFCQRDHHFDPTAFLPGIGHVPHALFHCLCLLCVRDVLEVKYLLRRQIPAKMYACLI